MGDLRCFLQGCKSSYFVLNIKRKIVKFNQQQVFFNETSKYLNKNSSSYLKNE